MTNIPDEAVAFGLAQVGKPYVWGATGPNSYDCSGLTQASYKAAGVVIPRTTYGQVLIGTSVTYAEAAPGDLIFPFADISHVVMYLGSGQILEAPKTGEDVHVVAYYGAAGGIRRVTSEVGTGSTVSTASLVTASGSSSTGQSSAISQTSNLISSLENGKDWASVAYIVLGAGLLAFAVVHIGQGDVTKVLNKVTTGAAGGAA